MAEHDGEEGGADVSPAKGSRVGIRLPGWVERLVCHQQRPGRPGQDRQRGRREAEEKFSNFDCIKGDDGFVYTAPVGLFEPNPWGLHDMIGNVWEWCDDWFDENFYALSPAADPPGVSMASSRVFRGGSWYDDPRYCRPAYRSRFAPEYRNNYLGFRVAAVQE